jgi:hypothetical protein
MGVVEIHTWNSDIADVDRPNRIVWDLDLGPLVSWKAIVATAHLLRDLLDTLGARAWLKTHRRPWPSYRRPPQGVAPMGDVPELLTERQQANVRISPDLYATAFSMPDYLRNNRTNTVGLRLFSTRMRRCTGVYAPRLAGTASRSGVLDSDDGRTAAAPGAARTVGRVMDDVTNDLEGGSAGRISSSLTRSVRASGLTWRSDLQRHPDTFDDLGDRQSTVYRQRVAWTLERRQLTRQQRGPRKVIASF